MSNNLLQDDQIFVVVDIEADGPTPGTYSILSIGAVACTEKEEVGQFYRKLLPLEGAKQHPETMEWWQTQPEAWQEVNTDAELAEKVMNDFVDWVKSLDKEPVFVSHPTALDYSMVSWYLWTLVGTNPFTVGTGRIRSIDLNTLISVRFNLSLEDTRIENLPDWLKSGMPKHTHKAIDDARGYSVILRNALQKNGANKA